MKYLVRPIRSLRTSVGLAGILLTVTFALVSRDSIAQLSTASLNGVVRDQTGAAVIGASVVLRNVDTSVESTTASNDTGAYALFNIAPGSYMLEARAAGFGSVQVPAFTLTVGQVATIDLSLKVAAQNALVTVEAATPQLDVSSANLGTVISTKQVNDLPLNGRNFTQLLSLTPGVVPISTGQNGMAGSPGGFAAPIAIGSSFSFPAINGQTNRSNFFLMDGLNDYGSFLSTYAVPPIVDAIQEFKVVSHTDSAEFGSVLGGVVNVVTKSGTNDFHGSAWEYARNTIFDARTYFLPSSVPKTPYSQNQFGGSGGGPVWIPKLYNGRDKTFFFGAYQGFRYSQTSNTALHVPTAAELAGDESDWPTQIYNPFSTRPDPANPGQYIRDPFPGNQIPASMIDSRMINYANFMFPQAGPVFDGSGDNALDTTPVTQTQNEWSIRVDERVGANDSAFFRYSSINSVVNSSGGLPGLPQAVSTPSRDWGGSYVHVFSPSLVLQGQFARTTNESLTSILFTKSITDIFNQVGFSQAFAGNFIGVNGQPMLPSPGIVGYSDGGENVVHTTEATDSYQYTGTLTKTLGKHEFHFGAGYISNLFASPFSSAHLKFAAEQTGDINPLDTINSGNPIASFILNVPNGANRQNVNETTRPGGVFSVFGQDSWKTSAKLTLNLGLRYDVTFIPPYGTNATIGEQGGIETGDMDFTNGTYIVQKVPPPCSQRGHAPCIPGDGTLPEHVVESPTGTIAYNTYTNIGPRVGLAYRADDKTVIHGAFGIVYDNWAAVSQLTENIEGAWPDIGQQIANNLNQPSSASATPTVQAQNPFGNSSSSLFPAPTPFNQVTWFYDPRIKNPYSEQWTVGAERQLNSSTAMTLNYVGSVSKRMDIGGYYNTALTPGPGDPQSRSVYTYIAPTLYDRSVGSANYNALQFSIDKRYSNGLAYQVAYTWSKAINVGADGWFGAEGGVPQDPYAPASYGSRSVAGTDLRNVLSVNTLYQVPVGKGRRFSTGNSAVDYVLGNWQINNIFFARSGLPFTPVISSDIANTGNGLTYETLDVVGKPNLSQRSYSEFFNTAAYAAPAGYTYGTAGRNSLRSAGYWDLDSSVFRMFPVGGERQFEFRVEAFNLLNNVVLGTPISDLNTGAQFGTVNTTANTARQLQLALKFLF